MFLNLFITSTLISIVATSPVANDVSVYPVQHKTLSLSAAITDTNQNTITACKEIEDLNAFETQTLPFASLDYDFNHAKNHYWSAANADLTPYCVVFPTCAKDISNIVSIINKYDDVRFAVKSGGHNPNVGFSSVNQGILIALSSMADTTLSDDGKLAYVGPGSRWSAVEEALSSHNLAVIGGRIGDVGVGGYTLGGGLSFLSAEYGFCSDTVMNYEVVLADASIVNANKDENSDLFWALKGGGNQFGIVSRFDFRTVPIGQVWGGTRIYAGHHAEALMNAVQEFTENFHDNKAAIIVTGEIAIESLVEMFVVFFFYDGDEVPNGTFDMFDEIRSIESRTKVQSYADLLNANNAFNLYGMRYLIRGTTLPVLPSPDGNDLLIHHYNTWKDYVRTAGAPHPDFIFSLAFQPIPVSIATASLDANNGHLNPIGLTPSSGAHIWMEYDISWLFPAEDHAAHSMAMNITATIDEYAKMEYRGMKSVGCTSEDEDEGDDDYDELERGKFNPIFLNDAMYDQMPLQSYGNGSYARLKEILGVYDPKGFFAGRTGGFRYID